MKYVAMFVMVLCVENYTYGSQDASAKKTEKHAVVVDLIAREQAKLREEMLLGSEEKTCVLLAKRSNAFRMKRPREESINLEPVGMEQGEDMAILGEGL